MPSISRQFILFLSLLFALTAQAAKDDKRETKGESVAPYVVRDFTDYQSRQSEIGSHENINRKFEELEENPNSSRYGIGYEIRQGGRPSTQSGGYGRDR